MTRRFVATLALGLLLVMGVAFGALTHRQADTAARTAGETPAAIEQKPLAAALTDGDSTAAERKLYPAPETVLPMADPLELVPSQHQAPRALQQHFADEMDVLTRTRRDGVEGKERSEHVDHCVRRII